MIMVGPYGPGNPVSRFSFCKPVMADAFREIPILIGTRTENQWERLGNIDSTFLFLNFFLDMEGNNFTQEEVVAP